MITIEKIQKMGRMEAIDTLKKILISNADANVKQYLIDACEERINRLDIDRAIVVSCDEVDCDG